MKKPRKPRPAKPQGVTKPISVTGAKKPAQKEARGWFATAFGSTKTVAGAAATFIGLAWAFFHWWPQISVEPSAAADLASNPLSGIFRVTNEQVYPIEDLSVGASLRCGKIGRGDDTWPIEKCPPAMFTYPERWGKHTLDGHQSYEINPGEVLFVTPSALLYAQIDIVASFQPWKIPWRFQRPFRFETRRLSDGTIQWVHIPND